MKRVVITGLGAVTPLGNSIETTWNNLIKGCSGIDWINRFDTKGLRCNIGGELKEFDSTLFMSKKAINRYDLFIHYGLACAKMALHDAGLNRLKLEGKDIGVIVGSSRGGVVTFEKAISQFIENSKPFSPYLMPGTTIGMAASYIAMELGITGYCLGISNACASGLNAIGQAFQMIRTGQATIMLAGGAEAPLCRTVIGGYSAARALTQNNNEPHKASRPFDVKRDGFVLSEGATVVVLEELSHAINRNASIYAEVVGYGMSADAFHPTKPNPHGQALAMQRALIDAAVKPDSIEYINAHAASTVIGDRAETEAIKQVFSQRAYEIAISATKSMIGHMLGASAAFEAAVTAISIKHNIITPTINIDFPDPVCDLDYVLWNSRSSQVDFALSNSFGFGGVNASIVLKKL